MGGVRPPRGKLPPAMVEKGYSFERIIGSGAFGCAMLVERGGQQFVAKEIYIQNMSSTEKSRALQEVSILSSLNHPNIVSFEDSFSSSDRVVIVMEYCPDGDLFSLAKYLKESGQHLCEDQVMSYFAQITLALKYMHDNRILHRDLKTCNVFLTAGKRVCKVGDFGISTVLRNTVAVAKTICGTPNYFSPEMCKGSPYSTKSDVWALGCVLFELCTAKLAFEGPSVHSIMSDIVGARYPPLPSQYSTHLIQLLKRLFSPNPAMRPSANAVLRVPHVASACATFQAALDRMAQKEGSGSRSGAGAEPSTGPRNTSSDSAVGASDGISQGGRPASNPSERQRLPPPPRGPGVSREAAVGSKAREDSHRSVADVDALLAELSGMGGSKDQSKAPARPSESDVGDRSSTKTSHSGAAAIALVSQQMRSLDVREGDCDFDDAADAVSALLAELSDAQQQKRGEGPRRSSNSAKGRQSGDGSGADAPMDAKRDGSGLSDSFYALIDKELGEGWR